MVGDEHLIRFIPVKPSKRSDFEIKIEYSAIKKYNHQCLNLCLIAFLTNKDKTKKNIASSHEINLFGQKSKSKF